jgi:hypothetical protein
MPGVQQQEEVGPEPDLRVGRPAVVGEEILAFRRREMDTGHGSAPPWSGGGVYRAAYPDRLV